MREAVSISIAFLVLHTSHAATYASRFPTPNICTATSSSDLDYGTWVSYDCPVNALCVPNDSGNSTCSCSYSEDMYHEVDGQCKPSTATYVFAALTYLTASISGAVFLHMTYSLYLAKKVGILRFDLLNVSCFFSMASSMFGCASRSTRASLLVVSMSQDNYLFWFKFNLGCVALYGLCVLAAVVTFGLAVHILLAKSASLRSVDGRLLFRRVVSVATILSLINVFGSGILLFFGQYALAFGFSAVFALVLWVLYHRIVSYFLSVDNSGPNQSSSAMRSIEGNQPPVPGTNILFRLISHFSINVLTALVLYSLNACIYIVLWYVGRTQRSTSMLGIGLAVCAWFEFLCLAVSLAFAALFMRGVTNMRRARAESAKSTTSAFLFKNKKETDSEYAL